MRMQSAADFAAALQFNRLIESLGFQQQHLDQASMLSSQVRAQPVQDALCRLWADHRPHKVTGLMQSTADHGFCNVLWPERWCACVQGLPLSLLQQFGARQG